MEELRFMLKHVPRKSNELIYMKCLNPRCNHCSKNPIITTDTWEDLKKNEFKWHNLVASTKFPGHYMTFLESLEVGKEMHKTSKVTNTWLRTSNRGKNSKRSAEFDIKLFEFFCINENFIIHLQVMLVFPTLNQSANVLIVRIGYFCQRQKRRGTYQYFTMTNGVYFVHKQF